MISLGWTLLRAQGRARSALMMGCSALVSVVVLLVIALLRLKGQPDEILVGVLMDAGTRGGAVLAVALLTVPALVLLYQVVKLGSATREDRLAGLRVAGATAGEVRRLAAFEVGVPVGIGAVLGLPVYGALLLVAGGPTIPTDGRGFDGAVRAGLVPTSVAATWWQVILVVLALTLVGSMFGSRVSLSVLTAPLGVLQRSAEPPPRPWGLIVAVAALVVATPVAILLPYGELPALILVIVAVIGLILSAPWVGDQAGRLVERRCASAPTLLAARRIQTRPRVTGRAAAAVGAVCLAGGGASAIVGVLVSTDMIEPFYVVALVLVAALMLIALLLVTFAMAVGAVDTLLSEQRSMAALRAAGMPAKDFSLALEIESTMVAMPMAVIGFVLGAGVFVVQDLRTGGGFGVVAVVVVGLVVVLALVFGSIKLAGRIVRPWSHRSFEAGHLRTE